MKRINVRSMHERTVHPRCLITTLAILALFCSCTREPGEPADDRSSDSYQAVLEAARQEIIQHDSLQIDRLDLGAEGIGQNLFRASVSNTTGSPLSLCLDLRTVPGLWYRRNWQKQYRFEIPPRETQQVEASYELIRLTPESRMRVRLGRCVPQDDGSPGLDPFFEKWYAIGMGGSPNQNPLLAFDTLRTRHLELYAWKGSLAADHLNQIAAQREEGLRQISKLLEVDVPDPIRLVFYPDSASKTSDTGHIGAGWAHGNTIVEIYNDEIQLDPYHELAHVVAGEVGTPPALFNEGFATYMAERLESDALRFLESPGKTVDEATCGFVREGAAIPLVELFRYTDIGGAGTKPSIAYPQSASLVKHLIETYGVALFREAYGAMQNTDDEEHIAANEVVFATLFGKELEQVEKEWLEQLGCP
ncbi:MAG: hypothetical protein ACE5G0_10290 [Rhodothermales bacterium]